MNHLIIQDSGGLSAVPSLMLVAVVVCSRSRCSPADSPRLQRWSSFPQTGLCAAALTGVSAQIPQTQRSVRPEAAWSHRAALLSLITLIGGSVTRKWRPETLADLIWPEEVFADKTESPSGWTKVEVSEHKL